MSMLENCGFKTMRYCRMSCLARDFRRGVEPQFRWKVSSGCSLPNVLLREVFFSSTDFGSSIIGGGADLGFKTS